MVSSTTENSQWSDWSISSPGNFNCQQSFNEKNHIDSRSSKVYPTDDNQYSSKDQSKKTSSKQCKLLKWWSSIPACVRGLLLGVLTGCSILAIVLPLWLIRRSTASAPSAVPVLRWNTKGITVAGISSNSGNTSEQLNTPFGIVLDYANNLYIADRRNNRIQKYLFGSSIAETVAGDGTASSSQYQLNRPTWVVLDSNKNLYVSDTQNYRVQFWPKDAVSGTTVAGTGSSGTAGNQLNLPYGIALNPTSGTLYISDYNNNRIMSYAFGANNGTLVFGGNGPGFNNTQLSKSAGLHFDSLSNSLIIANYGAHNIVRYVLGANSWTLLAGNINGSSGVTSTSLRYPIDMTFDPMGNMYVADSFNHRIQFFYNGQSDGTTLFGIAGVSGNNATTLNYPYCLRLDSQLNLYVTDSFNHRIQKFLRY